jgi:hypothetical protein
MGIYKSSDKFLYMIYDDSHIWMRYHSDLVQMLHISNTTQRVYLYSIYCKKDTLPVSDADH